MGGTTQKDYADDRPGPCPSEHGWLPQQARVVLVSDPTQARADRFGRLLRMKSGRDLNHAQVTRGWARAYGYNHTPFARVDAHRLSQRRARNASRGIWGMCD